MLEIKTIVAILSIVFSIAVGFLLKRFLDTRKPNGKKHGTVNIEIVIALSIVTVIALLTKDPFITVITVFLAYLVTRSQYDAKKSYIYQIFISIVVGIVIPYSSFWLYEKYLLRSSDMVLIQPQPTTVIESAKDSRHEVENRESSSSGPVVEKDSDGITDEEREFLEGI
jgi:uncharacterized membrane protein